MKINICAVKEKFNKKNVHSNFNGFQQRLDNFQPLKSSSFYTHDRFEIYVDRSQNMVSCTYIASGCRGHREIGKCSIAVHKVDDANRLQTLFTIMTTSAFLNGPAHSKLAFSAVDITFF